jgi:hypothetical protein
MSSWHKPDPSDELWPPEPPPLQRPPGNWAVRGYAAWQKWERDQPLSAQDVLALGFSPDSPLLNMKQVPYSLPRILGTIHRAMASTTGTTTELPNCR